VGTLRHRVAEIADHGGIHSGPTSTFYASVLAPVGLHGQKAEQRARWKAQEQMRGRCAELAA
jgi:hypothetical protein